MEEGVNPKDPIVPAVAPSPRPTRLPYLVAGVLALLLIAALVWKFRAVRSVEERAAVEKTEIAERTRRVLADQRSYYLGLTAKPFVWAIRREMLRDNLEQVNEYLVQFVKEPAVRQILVAGADGTVLVSTDKKLEGRPLEEIRPGLDFDVPETTLITDPAGDTLVLSPVMGLDSRIGTFLLLYAPEPVEPGRDQNEQEAP